jgi:uncharacterized membrane protein
LPADFVKGIRRAAQNLLPVTDLPRFQSSDQKSRLWPVDALHGLAVVGMVETHVYNVSADPSLLANPLAPLLDALNGLVAPLFFVLTGFILQLRPANTAAGTLGRRLRNAASSENPLGENRT